MEPRSSEQPNLPAIYESNSNALGIPSQQEMLVYQAWAHNAYDSQMYRSVGKESAILMLMLAAREFGIGPAQALNGGLNIIEGKVELSARIMSALIRKAGHSIQEIEGTDTKCTLKGLRKDNGDSLEITYTIEMAQKAGLIKEKGGWKRTPEDMLFARCISRLARRLFSDVIGIGYVEGEIEPSRGSNEAVEASSEESPNELLNKLLRRIDEKDHPKLYEYMKELCEHFSLSKTQVLKQLLKDPVATNNKFKAWMQKNENLIEVDNAA